MSRLLRFFVLLLLCSPTAVHAQRPIGEQYRDVSAVLADIHAKSFVYLPIGKTDKQLFYLPFFAMKADKDGRLQTNVQDGSKPNTKIVSVWMLISPENKVEAIAAYIRAQEAIQPLDNRFADVQRSQLIGIPFSSLKISEEPRQIGFQPVRLSNNAALSEIQFDAEVPSETADAITEGLRNKKRIPVFKVEYDLDARKQISQSDMEASLRYFSRTDAVKTLLGAPTNAEKFGWNVGTGGVELNNPLVTRDQRDTFEGRMKAEVKVLIQLEDDRDESTFNDKMRRYFDKIFQPFVIDTDRTPLGQELARMSSYNFDPADLKPNQIDKLVADVKNFFNQENADEHTFQGGTSASFMGIGGSANAATSGKSLRKRMEDKGWKFESSGHFMAPKEFNVFVANKTLLNTEGVLSVDVLRYERKFARFNNLISSADVYYPQSINDHLIAFETLKATVQRNHSDVLNSIKRTDERLGKEILKVATEKLEIVQPGGNSNFGTAWGVGGEDTREFGPYGAEVVAAFWTTDDPFDVNSWMYVWAEPVAPNKAKFFVKRRGGSNLRVRLYVIYRDPPAAPNAAPQPQ